ncbi:MAG: Ycf66 family protein [Cyanobacteriota bacterium]|nr:Ycf66 family protein [Cyanobacteriota bacterium]
MVATLAGFGALLLGLGLLMLPLLATELSRPGDSAWGALVLVLGLVLVTCADRLTGSPMLAVISAGLLIGRLAVEVGNGRWRQLSPEEKGRLGSWERWRTSLSHSGTALQGLVEASGAKASALLAWWQERRQPKTTGKRWVRQEETAPATAETPAPPAPAEAPTTASPEVMVVKDFAEVDALLLAAPDGPHDETDQDEAEAPAGEAG